MKRRGWLNGGLRIYFSDRCWEYNGKKNIIYDIKGSEYTEYANDDTITVTFENGLYDALWSGPSHPDDKGGFRDHYRDSTDPGWFYASDELIDLFDGSGYYYEPGNAWNFSLYISCCGEPCEGVCKNNWGRGP